VQLCAFFALSLWGKKFSFSVVKKLSFFLVKKNRCFFVAKAFLSFFELNKYETLTIFK